MSAARQETDRAIDLTTPPGPPAAWWRLLSPHSLTLAALYLVLRVGLAIVDGVTPNSWHPELLEAWTLLAAAAAVAAVVTLAADVVRARRAVTRARSGYYWGGYVAGVQDLWHVNPYPPNVVDLNTHRPALPPARPRDDRPTVVIEHPELVAARRADRRRLGVLAVAVALVAIAVGVSMWVAVRPSARQLPAATDPSVGVLASPHASGTAAAAAPTKPTPTKIAPTTSAAGVPAVVGPPAATPAQSSATVTVLNVGPIGDGAYLVGTDIAPGTWKAGAVATIPLGSCVYSINGGKAVAPILTVGAVRVTLQPGDTFTTGGCPYWHQA